MTLQMLIESRGRASPRMTLQMRLGSGPFGLSVKQRRPMLHARKAGRAKRPAGRRREDCRALLRKVGGATIAVAKESSAEIGRRRACKTLGDDPLMGGRKGVSHRSTVWSLMPSLILCSVLVCGAARGAEREDPVAGLLWQCFVLHPWGCGFAVETILPGVRFEMADSGTPSPHVLLSWAMPFELLRASSRDVSFSLDALAELQVLTGAGQQVWRILGGARATLLASPNGFGVVAEPFYVHGRDGSGLGVGAGPTALGGLCSLVVRRVFTGQSSRVDISLDLRIPLGWHTTPEHAPYYFGLPYLMADKVSSFPR